LKANEYIQTGFSKLSKITVFSLQRLSTFREAVTAAVLNAVC